MADSAVAITAGTGTSIDTRTEATNGDHRQVVVIGDPSVTAGVATVSTFGEVGATTVDRSSSFTATTNATAYGAITGLSGANTAIINVTAITGSVSVNAQVTADGTNWVSLTSPTAVFNVGTGTSLTSGVISSTGVYAISIAGFTGIRVITTAVTTGPMVGTINVSARPMQPAFSTLSPGDFDPVATVQRLSTLPQIYNGASYERQRAATFTINSDTSSARTATGNGTATNNNSGAKNLVVWINVTAVSGTSPTCVFKLQWSPDNGTTWIDWDTTNLQTTNVTTVSTVLFRAGINATTAAGTATSGAKQDIIYKQIRLVWTIGGTTPSFTFASWYTFTG